MTKITRKLFFTGLLAAIGLLALALGGNSASATPLSCFGGDCTVSDGSASITFDGDGTDPELDDFRINGIDQLAEQEIHMCITSCSTSDHFNVELTDAVTLTSATADEDANLITAILEGSGLKITFEYALTGGINTGSLDETITFENTSNAPITLILTDYFDYDLGGGSGNDTVSFDGVDTFTQTDGGARLSTTVGLPFDGFSADTCCEGHTLEHGDHLRGHTSRGPDDVVFVVQYDVTLNAVANWPFVITTQSTVTVPEPGALGLFVFGLVGLGLARRRRRQAC